MSELTTCNYCNMKRIRATKKSDERIIKVPNQGALKGFDVYKLGKGEALDHNKHFVSWMMEIPESCCC